MKLEEKTEKTTMSSRGNLFKHFDVLLKNDKDPDKVTAVLSIVGECLNRDTNQAKTAFEYTVKRLVKGLQSTNETTRVEFFTALVTVLKLVSEPSVEAVSELIFKGLTSTDALSKGEKRMVNVAKIFAYGALLHARGTVNAEVDEDTVKLCIQKISEAGKSKNTLITLAMPFVRDAVAMLLKLNKSLDADVRQNVGTLMVKHDEPRMNLEYLSMAIKSELEGIDPPLGEVASVDELAEVISGAVKADDVERLHMFYRYVDEKSLHDEFWPAFVSKIGQYDSKIFCACISTAVSKGCPLVHLITEDIVHMLLSSLHTRELGKDVKTRAIDSLMKLTDWTNISLSYKERKKAIKVLYKSTPNLLHEYQMLVGVIKRHISFLTEKELTNLSEHLKEVTQAPESETTLRNRLSAMTLLAHILQVKNATAELQLDVACFFFKLGFCIPSDASSSAKNEDSTLSVNTQAANHFITTIRRVSSPELVNLLFDYVYSVINKEVEDINLIVPLSKEVLDIWNRSRKIASKLTDETLTMITKLGALELVAGEASIMDIYDQWLEMMKFNTKKGEHVDIAQFIINDITAVETPFFNYEGVFRNLVRNGTLSEEAIQALGEAIDIGDDDDEGDDEMDSEDDDSEDSEEDTPMLDQNETAEEGEDEVPVKKGSTKNAITKKSIQKPDSEDEDSEATIDMDDATEEDLEKMDVALAGVFATKKRMKDAQRLADVQYMRTLTLVDILLNRSKEIEASVYMILLMPLVSALKHCLTVKPTQKLNAMKKTLSTLRRLSKLKKLNSGEEIGKEAPLEMATEIRALMKKKFILKETKDVLFATVQTLECLSSGEPPAPSSAKLSKKERRKAKKNKPSAESTSQNKPKQEPAHVNGSTSVESEPKQKPVKRKAQKGLEKKKAKLLRMSVFSEGLSAAE